MRVTGSSCSWIVASPGDEDYDLQCSDVHLLPWQCSVCDCGGQRLTRTEMPKNMLGCPPIDVEYMETCYECVMASSD
jgi:hypothetical protein